VVGRVRYRSEVAESELSGLANEPLLLAPGSQGEMPTVRLPPARGADATRYYAGLCDCLREE
jgi:hypothetical protein